MTRRAGGFLSIVEVFPPSFGGAGKEPALGLRQKNRDFVERVRRIQSYADVILVADVKDTSRAKLSPVHAAALLRDETGAEAVPVVTARDSNRQGVTSSILTALSLGLRGVMLVWGDRYSEEEKVRNVYDFASLSEMVAHARGLVDRAGAKCRIFAPVDIAKLGGERGVELARSRLREGADYLLAQPPTVDAGATLRGHERVLSKLGLKERVIPNVFPFRDQADVDYCRKRFGWSIPARMDEVARAGEAELLKEAKKAAAGLAEGGFPGVYVSTRGRPELARFILG